MGHLYPFVHACVRIHQGIAGQVIPKAFEPLNDVPDPFRILNKNFCRIIFRIRLTFTRTILSCNFVLLDLYGITITSSLPLLNAMF